MFVLDFTFFGSGISQIKSISTAEFLRPAVYLLGVGLHSPQEYHNWCIFVCTVLGFVLSERNYFGCCNGITKIYMGSHAFRVKSVNISLCVRCLGYQRGNIYNQDNNL